MVVEAIGNLLFLSALGVAAGTVAGLACAPALLSARARGLCRRLGPTPSLPSNYVGLACLLGIPVVLLHAAGTELLTTGERTVYDAVLRTARSLLRINYGLLLYVVALAWLGSNEESAADFDALDALVLLAWAVAYAVVAVGVLAVLL